MIESTVQQWEAVAEVVMKRDFKADGSTREAMLIGLRGWKDSMLCKQAALKLAEMTAK